MKTNQEIFDLAAFGYAGHQTDWFYPLEKDISEALSESNTWQEWLTRMAEIALRYHLDDSVLWFTHTKLFTHTYDVPT